MFNGHGGDPSLESLFVDYFLIGLDETPEKFTGPIYEMNFDVTFNWMVKLIEGQSKNNIMIWKKGELCGFEDFKNTILIRLISYFPDKKFVVVFNDYQEHDIDVKYVYDLSWWPDVLKQNYNHLQEIKEIGNNHLRSKVFLSRNNRLKVARESWINFLDKKNIKKDGYVSEVWNKIYIEDDLPNDIMDGNKINFNWEYNRDWLLLKYYSDVFCEVVLESGYKLKTYGCWTSEKSMRPFLFCVIPMIISFKNWNKYLKDAGFDMFDDIIDTSFYETDDLIKKFTIIHSNFDIIKNDLMIDGKFRDDIWYRLKKNQDYFCDLDNYKNYLYREIYD
jgi:hypothetical protein